MMIDGKVIHGGLTDRIRGCLSVYSICKKKGIPFYINWTYPFPLNIFLEPNTYNWEINSNEIVYEMPYSLPFSVSVWGLGKEETYIDKYFIIKNISSRKHTQYHVYSNAIINKSEWKDLYKELFKPSLTLQKALDENKKAINSLYYSVTFRFQQLLGDFNEGNYKILDKIDQKKLITKCIDELRTLCRTIPEKYKILVTSDSMTFINHIKNINRIYVIPGTVTHMNFASDNASYLKSFLDFYMIMGAEKVYLMQTDEMYNSGFPKFAAFIGNKPFTHHKF